MVRLLDLVFDPAVQSTSDPDMAIAGQEACQHSSDRRIGCL